MLVSQAKKNDDNVDLSLIRDLIKVIVSNSDFGAILVFVPGLQHF
jgi:hypothetical protein